MNLLAFTIRLFTGVQARWIEPQSQTAPCVYFANHTSHFDFLVLWAVLPRHLRKNTTAAGAADYWTKGYLRRWLAERVFNIVAIERENINRSNNPITQIISVLDQGKSVIIFPEGGRNAECSLKEFKCGLYHLAKARPDIDLIPTYINNASRVLPKGEVLPIPLICSVTFGTSLHLKNNENKHEFLERTQHAVKECAQI